MTLKRRVSNNRSPGVCKILLIGLLVFGGFSNAASQTEFSDREYEMFRNFYYDSLNTIFELAGRDNINLASESLNNLSEESQGHVCSIFVDYGIFKSMVIDALFKRTFGKEAINSLIRRVIFDLADVEWVPLDEVSVEDQPMLLKAKDSLKSFLDDNLGSLDSIFESCLKKDGMVTIMGMVSPYQLARNYTSVPVEFQLRDLCRSQLAFLDWVLENARDSEEKDNLHELIGSIKRKYLFDS